MRLDKPRLDPLRDEELPQEIREIFGESPSLNIFRTLAHHPKLVKRWSVFGGHVLGKSTLSARDREIAILLDRRIDPGLKLTLQLKNVRLRELLGVIATEADAAVSFLDNVVYIGPPETAARLRTVVELISARLLDVHE